MDFDDEHWAIRALLHTRFAWLPFNVWPLILVALAAGLWVVCGCHLHLHVGERHVHRTNELAKAADVLDDILERLDDVQTDMGHEDVQTDGSGDPNSAGE